jgi:hypothetical protein
VVGVVRREVIIVLGGVIGLVIGLVSGAVKGVVMDGDVMEVVG